MRCERRFATDAFPFFRQDAPCLSSTLLLGNTLRQDTQVCAMARHLCEISRETEEVIEARTMRPSEIRTTLLVCQD